ACYGQANHLLDALVAFVVVEGHDLAVAVDAESELSQVVGADGKAVEAFSELIEEKDVVRNLANRVNRKPVLAALQTEFGHCFQHQVRLGNSAHEREHDDDIRQAHLLAYA